jgi:hypothetical protein
MHIGPLGLESLQRRTPRKKMAEVAIRASGAYGERRANPRFPLRCPVQLKFDSHERAPQIVALTENVSVGGILLETPEPIPLNSQVGFVISVHTPLNTLRLKSTGRVLRWEEHPSGSGFWIAIQCKRPIRILSTAHLQLM